MPEKLREKSCRNDGTGGKTVLQKSPGRKTKGLMDGRLKDRSIGGVVR